MEDSQMWQDIPHEEETQGSMEVGVSMRAWQKPYDILLREAINRVKNSKGARLEKMFNFIRCKYPNMKYKQTRKGLGKALRRMIASGHIEQPCPGYYKMTGKPIYYMPCRRFDRTICGQQKIKQALNAQKARNACMKSKPKKKRSCTKKRTKVCKVKRRRRCSPKKRKRC